MKPTAIYRFCAALLAGVFFGGCAAIPGAPLPKLHQAAKVGNIAAATRLIDNGENVNAENRVFFGGNSADFGWTPLHYAAWNNRPDIAAALLDAGANADAEAKFCPFPLPCVSVGTPLQMATERHGKASKIARVLRDGIAKQGKTE